jgi:hypothetical protein
MVLGFNAPSRSSCVGMATTVVRHDLIGQCTTTSKGVRLITPDTPTLVLDSCALDWYLIITCIDWSIGCIDVLRNTFHRTMS